MLCCFFHRLHHASKEILIQPYFRISGPEKVHYFGIGAVIVLEPTGSSQITSGKPPKQAFLTALIFHITLSWFRSPVGGKLPVPFTVLE